MLLDVKGVDQHFRSGFWMKQVQVLHGITLGIPRRSIYGFLGANGAGKTTLIQLIVGLRRPTGGTITIDGKDAHTKEARARLGYLPERPYFHEHLTGEGVLEYFGALSGMSRTQVRSRIPDALGAVGMNHARKLELKKYSKGMLQRIGIAQAILHDPEFLVLDEPMSGLDPVGRKDMRELILKLAGEGRTIFFSSHVIPDVEAICDQVALIQKGRLIGCGPISSFMEGKALSHEITLEGGASLELKDSGLFTSVRKLSDGMRLTVEGQDQLNQALRVLMEMRASISSVTPIRPSLESFFEGGFYGNEQPNAKNT